MPPSDIFVICHAISNYDLVKKLFLKYHNSTYKVSARITPAGNTISQFMIMLPTTKALNLANDLVSNSLNVHLAHP